MHAQTMHAQSLHTKPHTTSSRSALHWRQAKPFEKLAEAYNLIHMAGGKVFTLRLNEDALICVTGSSDPARTMSRRVQRAFKNAGLPCPDIAFSLEVTPDARNELHLHGAIVMGEIDRDTIIRVLRNAAGKILGHAGSRQVQLKAFDLRNGGPEGWANYTKLGAARTRRELEQDRVTYMNDELRKHARFTWEQRRKQETGRLLS